MAWLTDEQTAGWNTSLQIVF